MTPIKATLRHTNQSAGIAIEEAIRLYQAARSSAQEREKVSRQRAARRIRKAYRKAQQRALQSVEEQVRTELISFVSELSQLQSTFAADLESRVTTLAVQLAENIIQSELLTNEAGIRERYEQLLQSVHGSTPEALLCHPKMFETVKRVSPLPVETAEHLTPGDLCIRTSAGSIQTDVTRHFKNLKAFLKNSEA